MLKELYEKLRDKPNLHSDYKEYELKLTRYGIDEAGSTIRYVFEERNGELYAYKHLAIYVNESLLGYSKVTKETSWKKMCTVDEAINFVKHEEPCLTGDKNGLQKLIVPKEDVDIFGVYNFQNRVKNASEKGNLKEALKLLGIVYFDGSLKEGNENTVIFEFSKDRTMAIEVRLIEKKIRFWSWIGDFQKGDYFWKYVFDNYKELWHRILSLLMTEYFSHTEYISCEIVSNVNSDLLCRWVEAVKGVESLDSTQ